MQKLTCEHVRRELDELTLNEEISASCNSHLKECAACRDFHATQTKLLQLVGGLGTVAAPADFDFKLRARLASEPVSSGFNFWPVAKWSLTAVVAVLLFVGGFSVITRLTRQTSNDTVAVSEPTPQPSTSPATSPSPESTTAAGDSEIARASKPAESAEPAGKLPKALVVRKDKRNIVSTDVSSIAAPVIRAPRTGREDVIFAVDANGQPLTVSLDDGRGNARTISLPTVSFGSQRVIGRSNQFAPKGVW